MLDLMANGYCLVRVQHHFGEFAMRLFWLVRVRSVLCYLWRRAHNLLSCSGEPATRLLSYH